MEVIADSEPEREERRRRAKDSKKRRKKEQARPRSDIEVIELTDSEESFPSMITSRANRVAVAPSVIDIDMTGM